MTDRAPRAARGFVVAAILIAAFVMAPEHSWVGPPDAHADPKFTATAKKPGLSTIYIKRGSSVAVKGRYLAKGDRVVSYKSSAPAVATVSGKGKVKGRKAGRATITLTTKMGRRDRIKVVVTKKAYPARSVSVSKSRSINVGRMVRLSVKTKPKGTTSGVAWRSSNRKVATVDAAGYIKGRKAGVTTIRVRTSNGKKAYCKLTVKDPVKISRKSASVRVDRPGSLKLTASAPSGVILWSSSDSSVATVRDGVVYPKATGVVDITAKTKVSGTTAVCRVTVVPHIGSSAIRVSAEKSTIYATNKTSLKAALSSAVAGEKSNDDIAWSSSDTGIAKVNAEGVVTGVSYGTAKITATAESGPSAAVDISVRTIKAKVSEVIITPGMQYRARFTCYGDTTEDDITYSSSGRSIARVTAAGNVYANLRDVNTGEAKAGEVTITAETGEGEKARMRVVVRDEPTIIDVSKWQGDIDWATASESVDLAILRVMHGADASTEKKYKSYADDCKEYGVPFGAYAYATFKSKKAAVKEATAFYKQAVSGGRKPVFFVVDAEESYIKRAHTEAYIAKLRSLAKKDGVSRLKVGVYVGHHLYKALNLNLKTDRKDSATPDFVWIPRYNSNIGARTPAMYEPDHACDMWQYSSTARIPGISGNVDINTLTDTDGDKLTKKSNFDLKWLTSR